MTRQAVVGWVVVVLCGWTMAGCSGGGGPDAGGPDATCLAATVTPPKTAGPYLRLEARGLITGAPVAGVPFAVDHLGTRVETVTDDGGNALVDMPDWDAGAVDVTYLDPAGGAQVLMSFLGIPRGESFRAPVTLAPPSGPFVQGTIVGKQAASDFVLLQAQGSGASSYFQSTGTSYSLDLGGRATPVSLLGLEFTAASTSPQEFTQNLLKWFLVTVGGPDGGTRVDAAAAAALPTAAVAGTLLVPPGAGLDESAAYAYVYGPPDADDEWVGLGIGYPTSIALNTAGDQVLWNLGFVNAPSVPALAPYRTVFMLGSPSALRPWARVIVDGLPGAGQVIAPPAPPTGVVPDGGVALPTPFELGPAAAGKVRGFRLMERSDSGGSSWVVWALDGRATVSLPARPTAGVCGLPALYHAAATVCTSSRLPAQCMATAWTRSYLLH